VAALRQEKEKEARTGKSRASIEVPLAAPQPTRATTHNVAPAAGMWDPSRGIQFGGSNLQPAGPGSETKAYGMNAQSKGGESGGWDPTKGIQFN
jgi:hypothetical protein